MNKLISCAAAVMLFLSTITPLNAAAETPPQDMRLSIETKEYTMEEVPADRLVELKVCAENLPPFRNMRIVLEKDSTLTYAGHIAVPCPELSRAGGLSFSLGSGENPNFAACNIAVIEDAPLSLSGEVITVDVYLPDVVQPGDFFSVRILRSYQEAYLYETSVDTDESSYGESYFTELASGGIRIVSDTVVPPAQTEPPSEPIQPYVQVTQPDESSEPNPAEETESSETTSVSTDTTVSSTTEKTTTSKAATTETSVSKTTAVTTNSQTEPQTTSPTSVGTDETSKEETEPQKNGMPIALPLILIGIVIGACIVILIINRKKEDK